MWAKISELQLKKRGYYNLGGMHTRACHHFVSGTQSAISGTPKMAKTTFDIWDTDYNSDNWEPEFMTIFVIWQLIVTLDSIRNSFDVF